MGLEITNPYAFVGIGLLVIVFGTMLLICIVDGMNNKPGGRR